MKLGLGLGLAKGGVLHGLSNNGLTNLLSNPQAFDNVSWTKTNVTVTANAIAAPDGTTTADLIIPTAVNNVHVVAGPVAAGSGTFTQSVFVKSAGLPRLGIRCFDGTSYKLQATFDISAGTIVSTVSGSATITGLPNGWFECAVTGTTASGNMGITSGWIFEPLDGSHLANTVWTGDATNGVYLWEGQAVSGSQPGPIVYS
jgi:hypothetical protein